MGERHEDVVGDPGWGPSALASVRGRGVRSGQRANGLVGEGEECSPCTLCPHRRSGVVYSDGIACPRVTAAGKPRSAQLWVWVCQLRPMGPLPASQAGVVCVQIRSAEGAIAARVA